jgi:hypothetical protein
LVYGLDDLERKGFLLTLSPTWPSVSFIKEFKNVLYPLWYAEIILVNFIFAGGIAYMLLTKLYNHSWLVLLFLLFLLTFPFIRWEVLGI